MKRRRSVRNRQKRPDKADTEQSVRELKGAEGRADGQTDRQDRQTSNLPPPGQRAALQFH
jgi:hypothetical protein